MDAPCSRTLSAKFCARPRLEKKRRPVTFFQSQGFTDFYAVISRGSSSPDRFNCDKCNRVFTSQQALTNHIQRHRPDGTEKRHKCNICAYATKYSSHLRQHMFTHSGEKPHKCPHCPSGFTQKSLLRKHLLTHEPKEAKLTCDRCSESFSDVKQLLKHTKNHKREDKPFRCSVCSKRFSKSSNLKKHEKKHAKEHVKEEKFS
ncbi:oocyte zinc finger protein XlCOF6-like isoform X2 [Stegodyphus dumicola]|uniref:oocyte zinc finger protein XlCOF6-like isoform X2 n=1 Tax=Stegodyphus dumicola TaxID=202533 RepID=UPI0015B0F37C|nr:oocyte zinc finger protein XlCOF6-like isoform X2 [Stegodyphus dumicola]